MPRTMAHEQSGGVRRRSLESAMKESQARTKVVLRHLPPSLSQAVLVENIDVKYAGFYTWFNFQPGKASHKKQVHARAYINFKKPEDVLDFYEDFDGHVFVNERGTQYKALVEYAPYQRIPKPRSKKDIREGTISKDTDYMEFLEMLGKPIELLPSAEVQLERREAEKAAALAAGGAKDSIVVTPLMEFVRQRRASKSAPQRSLSSKLSARLGVSVSSLNLASHKRSLERSRSGPLVYVADSSTPMGLLQKEIKESPSNYILGVRRDEQHRRDRELLHERKKKESLEGKEKKIVRELASTSVSSLRGFSDSEISGADVSGQDTEQSGSLGLKASSPMMAPGEVALGGETGKDSNKRELARRKQLLVLKDKDKDFLIDLGPGSPGVSSGSSMYNQRHRPPVSPKIFSGTTQAASFANQTTLVGEAGSNTAGFKQGHRRDSSGKSSSRTVLSPRDQQASPQQGVSQVTLLVPPTQVPAQTERAGKRPPRGPQSVRVTGKEQMLAQTSLESELGSSGNNSLSSTQLSVEDKLPPSGKDAYAASDKQDSRRVRNKDRPDRPVWTPRRRSDTVPSADPSLSSTPAVASTSSVSPVEIPTLSASQINESSFKSEKGDRGIPRAGGKSFQGSTSTLVELKGTEQGSSELGKTSLVPTTGFPVGSGKLRYVEMNSNRSSRGSRTGGVLSIQERPASIQGDAKFDSALVGKEDSKLGRTGTYNARENGESQLPEKDRRKQESAASWNELTGGIHRTGGRRERNSSQGFKDGDGSPAGTELIKPTKRTGGLALGSNEKQVWVAVQKAGPGT